MGVACVTACDSGDGKGKGKGKMSGIAVCAETDFPTGETLEGSERRIFSGFPRIPDLKRSLPLIDVTSALNPVTPVNFMTTVATISTDEAIQAGSDCGHRIFRFTQNPHLEHVARFPVVGRGFKTSRDDHPLGVLVENVAVQRTPPTRNSATQ